MPQTHSLGNEIYLVVGVNAIHSLRKSSICFIGVRRAFGNEAPRIQKEDTHLLGQKIQDIYGTEELKLKDIFRQFIIL